MAANSLSRRGKPLENHDIRREGLAYSYLWLGVQARSQARRKGHDHLYRSNSVDKKKFLDCANIEGVSSRNDLGRDERKT